MHPADIRDRLRKLPFEPFRRYVTDGAIYDVFHPDFVLVSQTQVVIGIPGRNGDLPVKLVYCDPLHITRLEPIRERRRRRSVRRKRA